MAVKLDKYVPPKIVTPAAIMRWAISLVALCFVWAGPRWMMALAITMLVLSDELNSILLHVHNQALLLLFEAFNPKSE